MVDSFEDHCWQDLMDDKVLEIYADYRRETYIGPRPALLAVDLYNLAYQGGPRPVEELVKEFPSTCGVYAWNAIPPTRELFAAVRSRGLPIIYTTTETRKEARPAGVRATTRRARELNPEDFAIREDFRPEPGDLIIYKERASGFFGTPLIAHLTQMRIDTVIVCGESTSGCVRASAVDAYSYGFHVVMVEECCFDRSLLSHKVNLFDLHHKYADVMHLEEIQAHLERSKKLPGSGAINFA